MLLIGGIPFSDLDMTKRLTIVTIVLGKGEGHSQSQPGKYAKSRVRRVGNVQWGQKPLLHCPRLSHHWKMAEYEKKIAVLSNMP